MPLAGATPHPNTTAIKTSRDDDEDNDDDVVIALLRSYMMPSDVLVASRYDSNMRVSLASPPDILEQRHLHPRVNVVVVARAHRARHVVVIAVVVFVGIPPHPPPPPGAVHARRESPHDAVVRARRRVLP
jgi:hypothetical protein